MTERYTEAIEELTGPKVVAFLSQAHVAADITMEIVFMDEPLKASPRSRSLDPTRANRELDDHRAPRNQ